MPRKTMDPENPVENQRAAREGPTVRAKRVFTSPAVKARVSSADKVAKARAAQAEKRRRTLQAAGQNPPAAQAGREIQARALERSYLSYRQSLGEHIRAVGDEILEIADPLTGQIVKWRRIDAVLRRLYAEAMGGKVGAAELLFERGWGKVPTPVHVDLKAEVTQLMQGTGLTWREAMQDPILSQIILASGLVVDGQVQAPPLPSPESRPEGAG